MKPNLLFFFALLFSSNFFCQQTDLNSLPKYDCSYKKWSAFSKDTIIVVKPNKSSYPIGDLLDNLYGFLNHKYIIKSENDLNKTDLKKSLLIVGKASDFKKWESFNLPIKKNRKGFVSNTMKFSGKQDAIWLNDYNRVAIIANDYSALKNALDLGQLGMDITVLQNNELTFFGNFINDNPNKIDWFNIKNLRKTNYNLYKEENADFYISKRYKNEIDIEKINENLKDHIQEYADFFKLTIPKSKLNILIHHNQQEIINMIGMWSIGCGGSTAGMNVRGEIHCVGTDQGLINHEMSHHIFNSNIYAEKLPPLLLEGVVEIFTNHENPELFQARLKSVAQNWDKFNFKDFFENGTFYNSNSALNYDLSGLYVQYFIDTYGLETFKSFCKSDTKIQFIESLTKNSFQNFNQQFKIWVENKKD